jgi:hypothetical protein
MRGLEDYSNKKIFSITRLKIFASFHKFFYIKFQVNADKKTNNFETETY